MNKSDNSPHFLLVGHEGSHNRGCESLVRSTVEILRREYPDSHVTVASMYPEHDRPLLDIKNLDVVPGVSLCPELYDVKIDNVSHCFSFLPQKKSVKYFLRSIIPCGLIPLIKKRLIYPRPRSESGFRMVRHLKPLMLSADAVISIGGDLFIEDWGAPPIYPLESLEFAQFLGCKTLIWGASIWPIKAKWLQDRVRQLFYQCDLVTVRDDPSYEYLASLGIKENIFRVSDGAFLMPSTPSEKTCIQMSSNPKWLLAFNGSPLMYAYMDSTKAHKFLLDISSFFRNIIDTKQFGVVFVPHDAYPAPAERDFLYEVMQAVNRPLSVYMPPLGLNAPETKAVIGECDYFIGMRFHSIIAALSHFIPSLGLSYSPKFSGLFQDVYGHDRYLLSYENISLEYWHVKLEELEKERDAVREQLNVRVPQLCEAALKNSMYLKKILSVDDKSV